MRRPDGAYSSVDEIVAPLNKEGIYERKPGLPFGPAKADWSYTAAPKKSEFYAPFISGAQRLQNGNTLICSGTNATIFEVTPQKEVVWKFVNSSAKSSFGILGMIGGGGGMSGGLFRSYRYGIDHPAFKGRDVTPGKRIEEL